MKHFALGLALLAPSLASAQSGVWTGYVNGWVPDRPAVVRPGGLLTRPIARPGGWWVPAVTFVQPAPAPAPAQPDVRAAIREERLAERERELSMRQAEQAAAMAEQQRRLAELERAEAARRDAELAAAKEEAARLRAALLEKEQEEREREIAAREAERVERAKASGPGPKVHKWVDEDGVVHFSTKPRS